MPVAPLTPADPTAVGGYVLLGRLGAGGMGTVYLARGNAGEAGEAGEVVAVKVLHERLAASPEFLVRFAAEAAAAGRVAGFCTARVLHADVQARPPYLVTEYVPGPTLGEVLDGGGPLPASEVEALAVGVAAALTAIHAAGIAHRDLKPSNVLLSRLGPRVIDFGVARALDAAADHTQPGMLMGTPGWLAPEQLRGTSTTASDVFVWGLLIARAGTRWRPAASLWVSVPSAAEIGTLPPPVASAVTAALHPDPAARPTARALLLRLCGSAEPGPVRTATAVLSRPWSAPYPTAVAQPRYQPRPAAPAVRRRRWYTRKRLLLPVAVVAALAVLSNGDGTPDPAAELPPGTARDGLLEFTVTGWECGKPSLGAPPVTREAQGQLCTVELRVRNFGDQARRVHVGSQKLHDAAGRVFSADTGAWVYLEQSRLFFQHEINPGNEITATLVYDIAKDAKPQRVEVHDSPLSGGASIQL